MAKADWCKVSPASGEKGRTEINISADPFTGRVSRSTEVLLTASGAVGSGSSTIEVIQKPKAEFITIQNLSDGDDLGNASQSMMLEILTNCSTIKVRAGQNLSQEGFFTPYTFWMYDISSVDGEKSSDGDTFSIPVSGKNGASYIELDCGKTGEDTEFFIRCPFSCIPNPQKIPRYIRITISNEDDSVYQIITLRQGAGTPSISVDPDSVELETDGSAVSVDVESNADWSAS